ncbi:aminopeptidase [Pediococcus argentinicus]|uniref:PepS aminopeptidase n=1 Tax=Pediococcus argentinicus TaxID=480391 RepID=A0A0R2NJ79_9LACO|nr:aminopeptidase [Pediococcus argentinicus]KRO23763.1 PepS aminopeptidase [Pediococcus argentinicus]NKZ22822.1 aminopeptidase [Pediococcus argentinicus]GEP19890.1 aminopeptidase [Pediococcus argentinicus]
MTFNLNKNLEKYADLITHVGVNIQPGQSVILYASITQKKLANLITASAYKLGAAEVLLEWDDSFTTKQFLQNAPLDKLKDTPNYIKQKWQELANQRYSRISLISDDPNALSEVPTERVAAFQSAQGTARRPIMQVTTNNDISWLVVAAADTDWAKRVFPNLHGEEAVNCLWEQIFKTTLVDQDDPIKAWQDKVQDLSQHADWLNKQRFDALKYSAPGTDLTVGLPVGHIWEAADSKDSSGNTFVANIPTEEVFTAPDNRRINGVVSSTRPLGYNGTIIENMKITFENGRVTDATAETGSDVLQHLLETDSGAKSLGEVSLVPDNSPISQSNIVFFNTLFDENASDHMAFGEAYPFTIEGGTKWDAETLMNHGMNVSQTHVDFMIGSNKMNIDGIKSDGSIIPIFRNGNWAK